MLLLLQLLKAAKSFSAVWQDGKTELAKDVLAEDVVSKDLLFGNVITGFDNWSKMVHGIFEVGFTKCFFPAILQIHGLA